MNFDVIFKVGEVCKWRCMVSEECLDPTTGITTAKWYDAIVHETFGSAMTLYIVNDHGESKPVPHYDAGEWKGCSNIGILNPELATERMRAYVQKKISNQKADHQRQMNDLRNEMRAIDIKGFEEEIPTNPI
jgi:hypothetical protein